MILQANSVGGVTDDETGLIYEIVRLAAVIEVTTYLHPYAPQPLPSIRTRPLSENSTHLPIHHFSCKRLDF